jgi:transcriptional regulatory protein RtcR
LAPAGRIDLPRVEQEERRLREAWGERAVDASRVVDVMGVEAAEGLDRFDRVQLEDVIEVCRRAPTLSAAGRELFAVSRTQRRSVNDADRLRKYLAKFDLSFEAVRGEDL